ncbi:MAG TPA: Ca2+-dependent phosphoinositide-specific phospholipase C, partial [Rhizomicrobium sp.]
SSCLTLVACLRQVSAWSQLHPRHVPIIITIKTNDERTPMPGATNPVAFNAAAFDALDAEILSVFPRGQIITPDQVQGSYPTLRDAVTAFHWPTLGQARGKILFVLSDKPQKAALYRGRRKSLEGRVMFIATDENSPAAAFVTIPDPEHNAARITADVKAGFMVRTRADAETREARKNDTLRRDWAFASGAQIISTDFLIADKKIGSYEVRLANDRKAVCDVQISPQRCMGWGVEHGNDTTAIAATGR